MRVSYHTIPPCSLPKRGTEREALPLPGEKKRNPLESFPQNSIIGWMKGIWKLLNSRRFAVYLLLGLLLVLVASSLLPSPITVSEEKC
jgi:hypothetical protein